MMSSCFSVQPGDVMKDGKLRVAVIGAGHLGEFHAQKYAAHPDVELVGVVDVLPDRLREMAARYQTGAYTDYHDVLHSVDAVSLAVPTERHFDVGRDVLDADVHMLIEKPITYDSRHADILVDIARRRGLVLQVGHVERFNPAVVRMESLARNPVFIECQRLHLFTPRGTDVDVVLDLMIHDLDIVLHMVGAPVKELNAVGMRVITGKTDICSVRLIFENGVVANLTASRVSGTTVRKIRVFQPNEYLSADCLKREFTITPLKAPDTDADSRPFISCNKTKFPGSDPLADEINAFITAVRAGTEPAVTGEDGRDALRAALAVIALINKGCTSFESLC
jgi:predicted dehydrogenase